jgi:hypothetical protein
MDAHAACNAAGAYGMAHPCMSDAAGDHPSGQRSQLPGSGAPWACGIKWSDVPEYNHKIEHLFALWQNPAGGDAWKFVRAPPDPDPRPPAPHWGCDPARRAAGSARRETPLCAPRRCVPHARAFLHTRLSALRGGARQGRGAVGGGESLGAVRCGACVVAALLSMVCGWCRCGEQTGMLWRSTTWWTRSQTCMGQSRWRAARDSYVRRLRRCSTC